MGDRVGIFGAGQAGAMAAKWQVSGNVFVCFIDNDERKQGWEISGVPVYSLKQAMQQKLDIIWVAVLNREAAAEIAVQIRENGFQGEVINIEEIRQKQDIRFAACSRGNKKAGNPRRNGRAGCVSG